MARMAKMSSRMRGAGCDHGMEKRLVMWGLIWLPSPRMKRPLESSWRSLARTARFMGLRANATAMPVPNSSVSVAAAPMAMGRNGSWPVSADHTPSYPMASARLACSAIPLESNPMPPSIFTSALPFPESVPVPAPAPAPLLILAPQELLQLGRDLVTRGHLVDTHGVAFGGIDVLFQLAHHRLVLLVVGD